LIILLLSAFASSTYAKSAGEIYLEYVNAIVPMTKEVADRDAKLREYGLFVDRASTLQSHLVQGSEDAALAAGYADRLAFLRDDCPEIGGKVDVTNSLTQILVTAQAANFGDRLKARLEAYRALARDTERACDDKASFDRYRIANLQFVFYYPQQLEPLAGASVKFAFGGEPLGSETTTGIPVLSAIYNFFDRSANNEQFKQGKARLLAEHATDKFYQDAAKRHCSEAMKASRDALDSYAAAATSMEKLLAALPLSALRAREQTLRKCLDKDRERFVAHLENEARDFAKRPERRAKWEEAEALALSSDSKKKITELIANLREKRCDEGDDLVLATEEELTLIDVVAPQAADYAKRTRAALVSRSAGRIAECEGGRR